MSIHTATATVIVPADPDSDDCLASAAAAYAARPSIQGALDGWDLAPAWGDDRETVALTVPVYPLIDSIRTEAGEAGDVLAIDICDRALAGDEDALRRVGDMISAAAEAAL